MPDGSNPQLSFMNLVEVHVLKAVQQNHKLFRLLDEMPEELLEEVQTFAEFLSYRRQGMDKPTA